MTDARVTQGGLLGLGLGDSAARVTQGGLMVLVGLGTETAAQIDQGGLMALAALDLEARIDQAGLMVLADQVDCVTYWQQLWTITRRDGQVLRFTSLDRNFRYGGVWYRACPSLAASSSESASVLGSVGNQELSGTINSTAISEDDLLAGLYDDAYVEVWLVPWQGVGSPRRLQAGWTGEMSRDESSFNMEVLGPGSRLDQQALVQMFSPVCDWTFGDSSCGYDIEAQRLQGEVISAANRGQLVGLLTEGSSGGASGQSESGIIWSNGRIRWTSGRNTGQVCEVKSVDFLTGAIDLWALAGFLPEPGDAFFLLPGCPGTPEACRGYANYERFGGFPDVPGDDAVMQTPDAKY